jgi:hypothetical protein
MDLKMQWTAFGLMAVALVVAVGVGMARNREMAAMSVSLDDYHAVNQERLGYMVATDHFVDRTHRMGERWTWQVRRGHEIAIAHFMDRARGLEQETLGWQVVARHFMAGGQVGARQEAMGWRNATEFAWDRMHGLEQERMGLTYMLAHQAARNG